MPHPGVSSWRSSCPWQSLPRGLVVWSVAVGLQQLCMVKCPPIGDWAISANPGGGTFYSWVGDGFTTWGATAGFDLPELWTAMKEPWVWALLFLLWLCSQELAGSSGSDVLEDVIFTQCKGASSQRTSSSVNINRGSMASLNSHTHSANHSGWPGMGSWAFSTQNCNALAYTGVLWGSFMQ